MNLDCRDIECLVQSYLDREMAEPEQQELLAHIRDCPLCRAAHGPLLEMVRLVEHAPPPSLPPHLLDRVLADLPTPAPAARAPGYGRLGTWLTAVAAAAAILLLAVLGRPGRGPTSGFDPDAGPVRADLPSGPLDPVPLVWMAANRAVPGGSLVAGLAGGMVAGLRWEPLRPEPARITVCIAPPGPGFPSRLAEPASTLLQFVTHEAALRGGLPGGPR